MPTQISASNQPLTLIEVRLHDDMMPKEICSNRRFVGFDESTTITSFKTSKHRRYLWWENECYNPRCRALYNEKGGVKALFNPLKYLDVTTNYGVLSIQFWSIAAYVCHYTGVLAVCAKCYFYASIPGIQSISWYMRILFQHSVALLILYRTPVLICHIGLKYLKSLTLLTNSANAIWPYPLLTHAPKRKFRQVQDHIALIDDNESWKGEEANIHVTSQLENSALSFSLYAHVEGCCKVAEQRLNRCEDLSNADTKITCIQHYNHIDNWSNSIQQWSYLVLFEPIWRYPFGS